MAVDIKVVCPNIEIGTKIKNEISSVFVGTKAYINNDIIITDVIKENDDKASFNITWFAETFDKSGEISCHSWELGYILGKISMLIDLKEGLGKIPDEFCSHCTCK